MRGARAGGSRRPFYVALVLLLALGAGAINWSVQRAKKDNVVTITPNDTVGAKSEGHVLGNPAAPVEIVEFADFECPVCAQWATVTEPDVRSRLIDPGKAKLRVFTFQVTSAHGNSVAAALSAECAADQGKFWEMHDRLFAGQDQWQVLTTTTPKPIFERFAKEIGLDMNAWNQCYDGRKDIGRIAANTQEATRRKVPATPTFIIGDKMLTGPQAYDALKALVDSASAKTQASAPADTGKKL